MLSKSMKFFLPFLVREAHAFLRGHKAKLEKKPSFHYTKPERSEKLKDELMAEVTLTV